MRNDILINVIAYNKSEIERDKTINLLANIHAGKMNFLRSKNQQMTSKNTKQIIYAPYAKFDLLCN